MRARTRAKPSSPTAAATPDVVDDFIDCLLHGDDALRRSALDLVRNGSSPETTRCVVRRLADKLPTPDHGLRQRVGAALVAIGQPAVDLLVLLLSRSRSALVQIQLLAVLTAIGPQLSPIQRGELLLEIFRLEMETGDTVVLAACARAIALLRRLDEERTPSAPAASG